MRTITVIPARNEHKTIASVVKEALRHVDSVIVVDDGSTDATLKKAVNAGAIVLHHATRLGKASCLEHARKYILKYFSFDVLVTLDGDGQHNPNEIPKLIAPIQKGYADVVVGERKKLKPTMPKTRRVINYLLSFVLCKIFSIQVQDTQCGFRAIKKQVLKYLSLTSYGYLVESEFLMKAARLGCRICNVPVTTIYNKSHKSKMGVKDAFSLLMFFASLIIIRLTTPNLKAFYERMHLPCDIPYANAIMNLFYFFLSLLILSIITLFSVMMLGVV